MLRQMPSLAGRDSPDTTDDVDSQDGSEDNSDFALHHATSLANDEEEEEVDHVVEGENGEEDPNEADDEDDESALEREAKELEGQLARIQSQGSTIYGVVSMESNSILATPTYLSDMRSNVGSRD